jgi:hypothetical protein
VVKRLSVREIYENPTTLEKVYPIEQRDSVMKKRGLAQKIPGPYNSITTKTGASRLRRGAALCLSALLLSGFSIRSHADSIVFAVIGDYGSPTVRAGDVAALVDSWAPDFVVGTGDNRYDPDTLDGVVGLNYCTYLTDVLPGANCGGGASATNAFFPVLGNRDYTDNGGLSVYLDYYTLPGTGIATSGTSGNERYYDFIKGDVHFFVVDSAAAIADAVEMDAQKAWLKAQLAASTSAFQIVLLHRSPYSSTAYSTSKAAVQWHFEPWGADAVISSHDRVYERSEQEGIPYFVNALAGKVRNQFDVAIQGSIVRYNDNYGAMKVTADDQSITFEFFNRNGALIDTFTTDGTRPPLPGIGSINRRVSQIEDDAEETLSDGSMFIDSRDIELGEDPELNGGAQAVGLRFQYIKIPAGSKITSAYLEFTVDEVHTDPTNVTIQAEATDSAAAFSSADFSVTSRARTVASVPWNIPAWDTVDSEQQSPDLSTIVQEIVDREGWSPENNIAFIIEGTGRRTAEGYDGGAGRAPELHVNYIPPGC